MQVSAVDAPEIKHEELIIALGALQHYLYLVYLAYSLYFKLAGLLLLAYISYRMGKVSLQEPIDRKVRILSQLMSARNYLRKNMASMAAQHSKTKKIVIWALILYAAVLAAATYFQEIPYQYTEYIWLGFACLAALLLAGIYIWQFMLHRKKNRMRTNDMVIGDKVKDLTTFLGSKVQNTLKNAISKELILKMQRPRATVCEKTSCQQHRALLRERYDSIRQFVEAVLGFQWCSNCKKRKPFDQMLSFETPIFRGHSQNEEEEVKRRVEYLINGMGEMMNWVNMVGPCNCSKLYWTLSTKEIHQYKLSEKRIMEALKRLERRYSISIK